MLHRIRVRWAEVDGQGIVFNAHYLLYADLVMTEYMRALGLPYPEGVKRYGSDLYAARAEIDFAGSATFDDELELAARAEYIGTSSFRLQIAIFRGDELLTLVRNTYVNASLDEKRPVPLAPDFVARIEALERTPPARK